MDERTNLKTLQPSIIRMFDKSYTLFGIILGGGVVLGALLWNRFSKEGSKSTEKQLVEKVINNQLVKDPPIQERIRQIALIEKDEFDRFYQPLISAVVQYLVVIGDRDVEPEYFQLVFKALRKRRSVIFEHGSSELDQKNKALWTYALFCAISIRFVVKACQGHKFSNQDKSISPYLTSVNELAKSDITKSYTANKFQPGTTHIHLIDKLLDANAIEQFEKAGIYPFIVNAVSGYYHERINPFYTIIEQVEAYIQGYEPNERAVFEQNIKAILGLVEQNTFSKNIKHSFVFEGMSYLLVDRNFLWEIFRVYSVFESKPIGKKDFETQLSETFELGNPLDQNTLFTLTLANDEIDNSQVKLVLELLNMVAIPYKAVPYYQYSDRKRIKKHVLQRGITSGNESRDLLKEHSLDSTKGSKDSCRRSSEFQERSSDSVGLKDLFSDSS